MQKPTEELLEVICLLSEAQDDNYVEEGARERDVKFSEYELQKIYFEVIKELVKEENLPDMTIPIRRKRFNRSKICKI